MRTYYPPIKPNHDFLLERGEHQLYVEESGEPTGIPVLFLHDGPGFGTTAQDRTLFDPEHYRIILMDQRGSGRSTPHGELNHNTTAELIDDIEAVREHLNIDRWLLLGGGWGGTLALLYAQQFPQRVAGMILRSPSLARSQEMRWLLDEGAPRIFPDAWAQTLEIIPPSEQHDLPLAFYERLTGSDELVQMNTAKHWLHWATRISTLEPSEQTLAGLSDSPHTVAMARIAVHYLFNDYFVDDGEILHNMASIAHIPTTLIHGRYDMVCPLDNALLLQASWPSARLEIIRDAGHLSEEPPIVDALIRATDAFAKALL